MLSNYLPVMAALVPLFAIRNDNPSFYAQEDGHALSHQAVFPHIGNYIVPIGFLMALVILMDKGVMPVIGF